MNLFLVFTRAQLQYVKLIVAQFELKDCFVVCSVGLPDNYLPAEVEIFEVPRNPLQFLKSWRSFKRKLLGRTVNLYAAHMLNIWVQDLFHHFESNQLLSSFNTFPDGNLLFRPRSINYFSFDSLRRFMLSLVIGCKYKLFKGNIVAPFCEVKVAYSYSSHANVTCMELKIFKLPVAEGFPSKNESALIIGHRNQKVLDAKRLSRRCASIVKSGQILYKPHPRADLANDLFYEQLLEVFPTIELIVDESPLEEVLISLNLRTVFAVASSSLITVKLIAPNCSVYCCGLDQYDKNSGLKELRDELDRVGVIEIDY